MFGHFFYSQKNILLGLIILAGLIFGSNQVFAEISSEEIDKEFQSFQEEIAKCKDMNCDGLKDKEYEDCLSQSLQCATNLQSQLSKWSEGKLDEIKEEAEELQKDIKSLKNQIGYLNAQVERTSIEVRVTEQQVDLLNFDVAKTEESIKNTENEIKNTENDIGETRQQLADNIKNLYEYDNQNLIKLTLAKEAFSDFFDEISYIQNLHEGVGKNLEKLKESKKGLENKKTDFENQKQGLEDKKQEVSSKIKNLNKTIVNLDSDKKQKAVLLEITKGDEEKYQELLAAIKAQTDQLLSGLSDFATQVSAQFETLGEWARFGVPLFLQTNYPGNLGPSSYSFSGNGCAVTSVAMVLASYGLSVDPMTLNNDWTNIFSCSGQSGAFCWYGATHSPYNMNIGGQIGHTYPTEINLSQYFVSGRPMIVFMRRGDGPLQGHYVVVTGKVNDEYTVNDPILGTVKLEDTRKFVHDYILKYYGVDACPIIDQAIIYTP